MVAAAACRGQQCAGEFGGRARPLGKQKTQKLSFGSSGSSTPHRLAGEMLQKYGGFTMTHIPYKGTAASVNDLLGGQIPLLFGAPTAVEPLATAGKIKLLGVTSEKRYPLLSNVPAISETLRSSRSSAISN